MKVHAIYEEYVVTRPFISAGEGNDFIVKSGTEDHDLDPKHVFEGRNITKTSRSIKLGTR